MGVPGHEIRNVLILACTEVEARCKNILRANQFCQNDLDYNCLSTKHSLLYGWTRISYNSIITMA